MESMYSLMKQLKNQWNNKNIRTNCPEDIEKWIDDILEDDEHKEERRRKVMDKKWWYAIAYMVSILLGNLFVVWFGLVKAFGLMFPAGALWIGLTFSARDFVQREWGDFKVWWFMAISTIITAMLSLVLPNHLPVSATTVALASATAFIVAEAIDWVVFTIFKWDIIYRIAGSNLVSTPIDSIIFVGMVFGDFSFMQPPVYGQAIVKYLSGLLVIPLILWNRRRSQESLSVAEGA